MLNDHDHAGMMHYWPPTQDDWHVRAQSVTRILLCNAGLGGVRNISCINNISKHLHITHTAIVGGGIGGTSAALFLDELFGGSALVDLYEEGRVGGRLAALDISGHGYEVGGSILHPDNQYMDQFVSDLGRCVSNGY